MVHATRLPGAEITVCGRELSHTMTERAAYDGILYDYFSGYCARCARTVAAPTFQGFTIDAPSAQGVPVSVTCTHCAGYGYRRDYEFNTCTEFDPNGACAAGTQSCPHHACYWCAGRGTADSVETYSRTAVPAIGDRVALAPHLDAWMTGDRYGVVVSTGYCIASGVSTARVRLDRSNTVRVFARADITAL